MTEEQVAELLAASVADMGSFAEWGRQWGVCPAYAMRVCKGEMHPGQKILDALGLQRVVTYEKAPRQILKRR
jgi:hypothetical protein